MTNEEYFTLLKNQYKKGWSRDSIIKVIENDYCDGLIFEDDYDRKTEIKDWGLKIEDWEWDFS